MRRATNGTFFVQTFGWYQDSNVSPATMISPTFIMLGSILCVLYALAKTTPDDDQPYAQASFDATEVLHVIAATANGDLQMSQFPPFNVNPARSSNNTYVRLRPTVPRGDKVGLFITEGS